MNVDRESEEAETGTEETREELRLPRSAMSAALFRFSFVLLYHSARSALQPPLLASFSVLESFVPMSLLRTPVAPASVDAEKAKLSSELLYLMESNGIPSEVAAKFGELGYTDVQTFAHLEEEATPFKEALKTDLTLHASDGPQHRALTAKIVATWTSARHHSDREQKEQAEQRAIDMPKHLPKGKHLAMQKIYTSVHKKLPASELPAPSYLDWRLDQIESGELAAESLAEVINKDEAPAEEWANARIGGDGSFRFVRSRGKGRAPTGPEELRRKVKLMAVAWEMVRLNFADRGYLQGLSSEDWSSHVDYILGDQIHGAKISDSTKTITYSPPWNIVLEYEFRVRQNALELVNDGGISLAKALVAARKDTDLRQQHFITPISLSAGAEAAKSAVSSALVDPSKGSKRQAQPDWPAPPPTRQAGEAVWPPVSYDQSMKGRGKGKTKSKGKVLQGKGKEPKGPSTAPKSGWRVGESNIAPDGRRKCYGFNSKGGCKKANCDYAHVCQVCNGKHSVQVCPRRPAGLFQ